MLLDGRIDVGLDVVGDIRAVGKGVVPVERRAGVILHVAVEIRHVVADPVGDQVGACAVAGHAGDDRVGRDAGRFVAETLLHRAGGEAVRGRKRHDGKGERRGDGRRAKERKQSLLDHNVTSFSFSSLFTRRSPTSVKAVSNASSPSERRNRSFGSVPVAESVSRRRFFGSEQRAITASTGTASDAAKVKVISLPRCEISLTPICTASARKSATSMSLRTGWGGSP